MELIDNKPIKLHIVKSNIPSTNEKEIDMIKGVLIVNNHGKARIVKFYEHVVRKNDYPEANLCLE